jgi:hypothetical protein
MRVSSEIARAIEAAAHVGRMTPSSNWRDVPFQLPLSAMVVFAIAVEPAQCNGLTPAHPAA